MYSLEKMSPSFNGITLNKLVQSVMEMLMLDTDKDIYLEKLKQTGYAYSDVYDNYVYNYVCKESYIVSENFPRLKAAHLPTGIGRVQYEILLSLISQFREKI